MEKQNVVHPYKEILQGNKKGWTSNTCYHVNGPKKHAKEKKPNTKDHILHDSIDIRNVHKWPAYNTQISRCLLVKAGLTTNKQVGNFL